VDDDAGTVTFAEEDASSYGVVDEIVRRALLTGGRVLAVRGEDVPGGPVAAILRHPLRVPPDGAAACARRSTRVTRPLVADPPAPRARLGERVLVTPGRDLSFAALGAGLAVAATDHEIAGTPSTREDRRGRKGRKGPMGRFDRLGPIGYRTDDNVAFAGVSRLDADRASIRGRPNQRRVVDLQIHNDDMMYA
jgi:hypothetical protein